MKILLVTEYFYPQSAGGTELYVYNLAKALQQQLHQVEILSVSDAEQQTSYNGLIVHYIPSNKNFATNVIAGEEPADNLNQFVETVKNSNPNIVHFHTLTTSINTFHIEAIKQKGFKTLFTSHVAAATCLRGTLMQNGEEVCNGKIEEQKCLSCYLQNQHLPKPLNHLSAFAIRTIGWPQNLAKVVSRKKHELRRLNANLDKLLVVSNWQKTVFSNNNFEEVKTVLCRQAIQINKTPSTGNNQNNKLVIGFLGRISAVKGLHILLAALKDISNKDIELRIAAIPVATEILYYQQQKQQVETMPNATWTENLPNEQTGVFLSKLDVLCVPSQCLETGPFVVYEALAQGIPVAGSDLGGIKELITEGRNGWLFPHQNTTYLSNLINSFIARKTAGNLLKSVEPITRPIENLAAEMLAVYHNVLAKHE